MTERNLDQYLSQWAAQNALSTERADAIRRTILSAPPVITEALTSAWWGQFSEDLSAALRKSVPCFLFPPFAPLSPTLTMRQFRNAY